MLSVQAAFELFVTSIPQTSLLWQWARESYAAWPIYENQRSQAALVLFMMGAFSQYRFWNPEEDISEYQVIRFTNVSRQRDQYNCGVFCLIIAQKFITSGYLDKRSRGKVPTPQETYRLSLNVDGQLASSLLDERNWSFVLMQQWRRIINKLHKVEKYNAYRFGGKFTCGIQFGGLAMEEPFVDTGSHQNLSIGGFHGKVGLVKHSGYLPFFNGEVGKYKLRPRLHFVSSPMARAIIQSILKVVSSRMSPSFSQFHTVEDFDRTIGDARNIGNGATQQFLKPAVYFLDRQSSLIATTGFAV
ncbi:hypothetical protein MP228_005705 [Amoeboaphelidium protococcarum]|nr:hypothetical protein MP228_005705 [Amoeboaphelidium protococcarum]